MFLPINIFKYALLIFHLIKKHIEDINGKKHLKRDFEADADFIIKSNDIYARNKDVLQNPTKFFEILH